MGSLPGDSGGDGTAGDTSVIDIDSSPAEDTLEGDAPPKAGSSISGTWVGYIEAYKLPSGSDVVTIEVTELTDGSATGRVYFGTKAPPPPPTDGNVRYPADFKAYAAGSGSLPFMGEGFHYRMRLGLVAGKRLTMQVYSKELWKTWCELQTSYDQESSSPGTLFACLPNWGSRCCDPGPCSQPDPATGKDVPRDCGQLYLCSQVSVCYCTASGCTVPLTGMGDISFDVSVSGDQMDGSISGVSGLAGVLGDHGVHLTRKM